MMLSSQWKFIKIMIAQGTWKEACELELCIQNCDEYEYIIAKVQNKYSKTSNISRTLVGNEIVDNLTPGFNGLSEDNCKRI